MFNSKKSILRKIWGMIVLVLILAYFIPATPNKTALAAEELQKQERENIEEMIYETALQEGKELNGFSYIVDSIYFSNEERGGYLIEFTADECLGYAIIFRIGKTLKAVEINFNTHSPYYNKKGLKIYPALGHYYLKVDGEYYDAFTMEALDGYVATDAPEFYASCKSSDKKFRVATTREVKYNYGFYYSDEIPDFYTSYSTSITNHSNNCANAAGLIAVNYWNKKYNNDLLKLSKADLSQSSIARDKDNIDGAQKAEIMKTFYKYMNTNWFFGTGGTLPNDCYSGFEKLIKEKGYKVSRDKDLSYDEMVSYIQKGIPIFITSIDYYFSATPNKTSLPSVSYMSGDNKLTIAYERSSGLANSHTFVGYGFAYYSLYDNNEKNSEEQLIKVANGWGGSCYFNYTVSNKFSSAAINVFKD